MTNLWSVLSRKFLGSEPALIAAATTALVEKCSTFDGDASNWEMHFQSIKLNIAELQQRGSMSVEALLYCLIIRGFVNAGDHWDMLATILQQEKAPSLAILRQKAAEHCVFRRNKPSGIAANKALAGPPTNKNAKILNKDPTVAPCSNPRCRMNNHAGNACKRPGGKMYVAPTKKAVVTPTDTPPAATNFSGACFRCCQMGHSTEACTNAAAQGAWAAPSMWQPSPYQPMWHPGPLATQPMG